MAYLLCPQIQREELAVKVFEGPSTFAAAMESAEAERRRKIREADFRASAGAKSAPKKLVKEKHEVTLPTRSDEPGFGWYKKACCELCFSDCGIRSRFHKPGTVLANSTPMPDNTCCNCSDDNGEDVDVRDKVKLYKEQSRSGTFQKEFEEVDMTLWDFKMHFIKCIQKYLKHHFNDIMSSQVRRNLY
jgi:hypothetical protein